jgi:hypothetical protein
LSETLKDGKNIGPKVQNLFPSPVYLCPWVRHILSAVKDVGEDYSSGFY